MRSGLAYQDAEQDEGRNPAVFLVCVNYSEAEYGDHVGDDCYNDTADADSHRVVGYSAEDLAADDDIDDAKATTDNNVEDGG